MERSPAENHIVRLIRGCLMAFVNESINRKAAGLLDVQPTDEILEIGFGPGRTIPQLARRAPQGFVGGIDPSPLLVRLAASRNRGLVWAGRVEVKQASVSDIPYPAERFDKVLTVNSYPFWPAPAHDLEEVRRVMKPGGLLVLALKGKRKTAGGWFDRIGFGTDLVDEIRSLLEQSGFQVALIDIERLRFMSALCFAARRS